MPEKKQDTLAIERLMGIAGKWYDQLVDGAPSLHIAANQDKTEYRV